MKTNKGNFEKNVGLGDDGGCDNGRCWPVGPASRVGAGAVRGHSATRSFNPATVAPGGQVTVTIAAANYGQGGGVTETLPSGFTYVSSSEIGRLLDASQVTELSGNQVRFILSGRRLLHLPVHRLQHGGFRITASPAP